MISLHFEEGGKLCRSFIEALQTVREFDKKGDRRTAVVLRTHETEEYVEISQQCAATFSPNQCLNMVRLNLETMASIFRPRAEV